MSSMYSVALLLHSWLRWAVLLLVLVAALRAISGSLGRRVWTPADRRANMLATISLDVQTLVGSLLYLLLSPITTGSFSDMGAAMRVSGVRFWVVEHPFVMFLALVVAHVGNVVARTGATDTARHRRGAILFVLVLLLVLMGTPWPGMANGRPLFSFGF